MEKYFLDLKLIHPKSLAELMTNRGMPPINSIWEIENEIKPCDLYCYLYAKYGQPNGLQNFLRSDDSDNLIHWEWVLGNNEGLVTIQGHNFRTEIHLNGVFDVSKISLEMFINQVKGDISKYGKDISELRKKLEKWSQFINPYHRISAAIDQNMKKLEELDLNPEKDKVAHPKTEEEIASYEERWKYTVSKYNYATGLIFGLRTMLPILAESFVNLLIFVLSKPEIKQNDRLFQNTIRQPIDVRVQSLHLNCSGFDSPVDYKTNICKLFHTLMNDRNDLLHGNVEINKLTFSEVFFNGKVPIFMEYGDFWDRSVGISLSSVGYETLHRDYETVREFIKYIHSCLTAEMQEQIEFILERSQLGINKKSGRLGVLFPDHMVDFRGY